LVAYKKYLDLEIFEGEISSHEYPWHFHNCYTLIVVEKGSIKYEFHNKSENIEAGKGFIIEPVMVHRNIISQPTVYKALFIPHDYFDCIDEKGISTQKLMDSKIIDLIFNLFHKIELKYAKNELKDIIFGMCELINPPQINISNDAAISLKMPPKINYDLTINELADEAHLSKFHFQRKFKKNCGLTVGQLKQQEKTIQAKSLLENGKLAPDVAHELGFFDQSHFIKYFKKMWALTPKNFK
jgi:AraC-like DNA-binding protein